MGGYLNVEPNDALGSATSFYVEVRVRISFYMSEVGLVQLKWCEGCAVDPRSKGPGFDLHSLPNSPTMPKLPYL